VPLVFQEDRVLEFLDSQNMKVVRLSAPHTGQLNPHETSLILIDVSGWVEPRDIAQLQALSQ
jgi:hypothetical protein